MNTEIIVALIAGIFSVVGTIITVAIGNKRTEKSVKAQGDLTLYRIEQLEKKQDKHNCLMERVFRLEKHEAVIDEEIKVANHRIEDLEKEMKD
jgi:hypothetical protein